MKWKSSWLQWTAVLVLCVAVPAWASPPPIESIPWDAADSSIATSDDAYLEYVLPFVFPFFGRSIVAISVNTNGLVELLESGESCVECADVLTHDDGDHFFLDRDMLFAANDDLISDVVIQPRPGRVVVTWVGTTASDSSFELSPMIYQVVLHDDGRIHWKFYDMDWSGFSGDLWSGYYDAIGDVEVEIPAGSTSFSGRGVQRVFEYDPGPDTLTEIGWSALDVSVATTDDGDVQYALPFVFAYAGRAIESINVNTNGLIELLEASEGCAECADYLTHADGDHVTFDIDAAFGANDDLIGGVIVDGDADSVTITWVATTLDDDDFEFNPLVYQVVLVKGGQLLFKFFDMDYALFSGDLFSGLYDEVDDVEVEIPGGSTAFSGRGVDRAFATAHAPPSSVPLLPGPALAALALLLLVVAVRWPAPRSRG